MNRIYHVIIKEHFDKNQQMLFLAGPRQVGKTTIARQIGHEFLNFTELNWDVQDDKQLILSGQKTVAKQAGLDKLNVEKSFILFDEIHKYPDWKNFLKGFYDKYGHLCHILVTGSAQLDMMRQGGDSLMGRYFLLHIHPFSVAECLSYTSSTQLSVDSFLNVMQAPLGCWLK